MDSLITAVLISQLIKGLNYTVLASIYFSFNIL